MKNNPLSLRTCIMFLLFIVPLFFIQCSKVSEQAILSSSIDVLSKGEQYDKYWERCVGAGRANEGLRASWLDHLQTVKENCGFQYLRFHGLFHDDMFPYFEKEDGNPVYNWQYIDELFDRMLAMDVKPFVELSFFPKLIAADDTKMQFWWKNNVTPDEKKYDKWYGLVKAFTQHCVDRYGIDEVLTWYFEVWNEPNLDRGFFDGTKSQYFELYKYSVQAVKSVDQRFKVGGPATSNFVPDARFDTEREDKRGFEETFAAEDLNTLEWRGVWIEDFLKYCEKEKLPVDFVSTHPYPTDYALNPNTGKGEGRTRYVNSTIDDMNWMKKTLAASAYPNAEIHYSEWSTSPNSRDGMHDLLPPAAYLLKTNLDCIGLGNSLSYWTFTDIFEEKGGAESIFHGGFGMINFQGLVKPSYHAYAMLHQLGNIKLHAEDGMFISKCAENGKISTVMYNYPVEYERSVPQGNNPLEEGTSKTFTLALKNLKSNTKFNVQILDKEHGNVHKDWIAMGKPEPPTREQIRELKQKAENLKTITIEADKNGNLVWEHTLTPWECVLITQI